MTKDAPTSKHDLTSEVVPRVTTARLELRSFRTTDLDALAICLADEEASEFVGGVSDRRAAWRTLATGVGLWVLTGGGWWGVEMRETGELVGTMGAFFRETAPDVIELGWTTFRAHWGKGIASEAAQAAMAYAFEAHPVPRVIAHIDGRNAASVRVSQKLGMQYQGEVAFYDDRTGLYTRERP